MGLKDLFKKIIYGNYVPWEEQLQIDFKLKTNNQYYTIYRNLEKVLKYYVKDRKYLPKEFNYFLGIKFSKNTLSQENLKKINGIFEKVNSDALFIMSLDTYRKSIVSEITMFQRAGLLGVKYTEVDFKNNINDLTERCIKDISLFVAGELQKENLYLLNQVDFDLDGVFN